jgi:serine/threonine protein kinase
MSQPTIYRRLKRVKGILGGPPDANEIRSTPAESGTPEKVRRMLKILLKNPWDDYTYIRRVDQVTLVRYKAPSFQLANIREVPSFDVLIPPILPKIQHPNIATIYDIYSHDNRAFLVTEHLDVPFAWLEFEKYELEEREIATIIAEVPDTPTTNKTMTYYDRS